MSNQDVTSHHRSGRGAFRLLAAAGATAALALGLTVAPSAPATAADVPDSFTISGSGYGHGVGMAQYGAYQMAREGRSPGQILGHYYQGARNGAVRTPRDIDVQVYGPDPYGVDGYGDSGPTRIDVKGGTWALQAQGRTVARGSGPVELSVRRGGLVVRTDGRTHRYDRMWLLWSGTPHYRPDAAPSVAHVRGAHGSYRWGRLQLSASAGVPNVVNRVPLNGAYLFGLAEMPASWGAHGGRAALEAQAIVARSFALLRSGQWKARCRCHVVDDVRDQHFSGFKNESGASAGHWIAAVKATRTSLTRARVLTWSGRPVEAHYFSSSGGRTAHSEDVWASEVPYERSVADPYSLRAPGNGHASWSRRLTQKGAQRLFGLSEVASIKIADRYRSGQVAVLVAKSPSGKSATVRGSADHIRSVVGKHTRGGNVPSSWIDRVRSN
ncbi:SpoIID/LytB domain-containing protein [Promicromonospora thailandica]|uniref:Stage II sporulation protein D n=1 Tax=Promicromonospora thailandica TaxID=765201 RepID=A0A9X2GBJ2_9MICO|nr:SpoIID/LytB domain-containing protein [Promicromonospora thailandica]MCP2266096.1 stage II sporulation protein D [Promicromonospora thailandica]